MSNSQPNSQPQSCSHHRPISRRDLFKSPGNFLAFGFGAGLVPVAPGTCGTLVAVPFFLLLHRLPPSWYAIALLAAFIVGISICARAAASLNLPKHRHDHPGIVWDEMVGLWVTLAFIPFSWDTVSWITVILGFALFRLFDIAKPWPIRLIDRRLGGGLGIMLDDLLAGVFANLALRLILSWSWF